MRPAGPGRGELLTAGDHDEDLRVGDTINDEIEKLEGRRIDPMRILKHEKNRAMRRETDELIDQCSKREILLPLGVDGDLRVSARDGHGQQESDEGRRIGDVAVGASEQSLDLVELRLRSVAGFEPGRAFQLLDDRMQRGVRVIG